MPDPNLRPKPAPSPVRARVRAAAWLAAALALAPVAACPKPAPAPVIEAPTRTVDDASDLVGAEGAPATVVGTLARRAPPGETVEGTAIVLSDDSAVYVSEGAPPEGWDWMLGTMIRVQGVLWEHPPTGWPVPKLEQAEAPMPADVSIPILPF